MQYFLAESRALRFFSFAIFYVAQGLPIGLNSIALPAWLAEHDVSPEKIAMFVAISGLPWGFKLVAGPIMDRFSFLPMGRRRPWVIIAQFVLFAAMVTMGFIPDPANNVMLLTWVAFAVNCGASVQDVAVDGMAIDVLPSNERGRANAFMAFGQVAGYSVSGALTATVLILWGLPGAAWTLAVGIGLIWLWALIIRERRDERRLPWSEGEASARSIEMQAADWLSIFRNLLRVMFLPASLILVTMTLFWRVAGGFWVTAAPVMAVQELGYASTQYSHWTSGAGFAAACLGLLLGPLIDRVGTRQVLVVGLLVRGLTFLAIAMLPGFWHEPWFAIAVLIFETMSEQAVFISFIAIHMNICWTRVSATQFAIYMAWANLARSIGAGLYGQVEPHLSDSQIFLMMAATSAAGIALLMVLRLRDHEQRLARLDAS